MDTHIYLLSTIPTAVLTASGSRVSSQPFGITNRHPFVSLSIIDVTTFGAARAELSLLKFCRVATNVALNYSVQI